MRFQRLLIAFIALALVPRADGSQTKSWNNTSYSIPEAGERNWGSLTDFLTAIADNAQTIGRQKTAVRIATATPVTFSATTDHTVLTKLTVPAAVTVNLPAGVTGLQAVIVDGTGDAATNNVTIDGNASQNINGATTYVINVDRGGVVLSWTGTEWSIIAEFVRSSSGTGIIARNKIAVGTADHVVINSGTGALSSEAQLAVTRGGTGISSLGTGVATWWGTPSSANLKSAVTDETGSGGALVFATSPALTTPDLGTPSAATLTNATGLPISTGISGLGSGVATWAATPSSANLISAVTGETGTGALVFADTPTLIAPLLGTPTSGTLTNATGLPVSTGISGLGTGVATWLATPSSSNLISAVTGETGTGALVFADTPTLIAPLLGTPTSGTLTNATGLPLTTGVTGTLGAANGGTGVANNAAETITMVGDDAIEFTTSAATTVTLPTSGTLATLAGTEALTNKDYQGGTASNSSRLTVPSTTKSTLDGLTRKEATLVYATDLNTLYADDGSSLVAVGSGSSGELNLVDNPNDAYASWSETGTVFNSSPTTTTTSGSLPLEGIVSTAIQMTSSTAAGAEASEYVSTSFTTPAGLASKLKVEFYMRPGTNFIASEWTVSVYATATRQALSTDSSAVTYLPNATGKFTTTFDAVASTAYTLRFARPVNAGGNAGVLNVANVIVGPGIQPQGAVAGPWISYTPTGTWSTNTTYVGFKRRVGDMAEYEITISLAGAPTSANLSINQPSGETIDTSRASSNRAIFGYVNIFDATGASSGRFLGSMVYESSTTVTAYAQDNNDTTLQELSIVTQAFPVTFAASDKIVIKYEVPIAGWAGSGAVNLAQNDVEYAYNTDTSTTAGDTTDFAYGPGGAPIQQITAALQRRVQFQTPVLSTDILTLEISPNGTLWVPAGFDGIDSVHSDGTTTYGVGFDPTAVGSNYVTVQFGLYRRDDTTFAGAGAAWGATYGAFKWRVKKAAGGQAVGFGLASTTSSGLVNPYTEGSGVVYAGTYTPTLTGVANVGASTAYVARYMRVGSVVTVSGTIDVDPTLATTATTLGISLPISSNFTGDNCAGVASGAQAAVNVSSRINADTTNDRANMTWISSADTANQNWTFTFTYSIL